MQFKWLLKIRMMSIIRYRCINNGIIFRSQSGKWGKDGSYLNKLKEKFPEEDFIRLIESGKAKRDIWKEMDINQYGFNALLHEYRIPEKYDYNPYDLISHIKSKGFILRLSIAMTTWFDDYSLDEILHMLKAPWAPDQVSFKKLYGADTIASKRYDEFVTEFKANSEIRRLELLPIGSWKYEVNGIAIVWNDDCMVRNDTENPRYLILQPDGRLYTRWDSKASVIY